MQRLGMRGVCVRPTEELRKEDSLKVKVQALLAERRQRIGYERQLIAAVASCH